MRKAYDSLTLQVHDTQGRGRGGGGTSFTPCSAKNTTWYGFVGHSLYIFLNKLFEVHFISKFRDEIALKLMNVACEKIVTTSYQCRIYYYFHNITHLYITMTQSSPAIATRNHSDVVEVDSRNQKRKGQIPRRLQGASNELCESNMM